MFVGISTSATPWGRTCRVAKRLSQIDFDRRPVENSLRELCERAANLAAISLLKRAQPIFGRRVLAGDANHRAPCETRGAEAGDRVRQPAASGDAADAGRRGGSCPSIRRVGAGLLVAHVESLMPCSRNAARIGQVWPPLTANRYLTPCDCRTRAIRAPPSIFRAAAGADLDASSPASAPPAVFPITTLENPSLELREFVMWIPFSLFALPYWRIRRGEHGAGPFRWRFSAFRLLQ